MVPDDMERYRVDLPPGFKLRIEPRGECVLFYVEDRGAAPYVGTRGYGLAARALPVAEAEDTDRVASALADIAAEAWRRHEARIEHAHKARAAGKLSGALRRLVGQRTVRRG